MKVGKAVHELLLIKQLNLCKLVALCVDVCEWLRR